MRGAWWPLPTLSGGWSWGGWFPAPSLAPPKHQHLPRYRSAHSSITLNEPQPLSSHSSPCVCPSLFPFLSFTSNLNSDIAASFREPSWNTLSRSLGYPIIIIGLSLFLSALVTPRGRWMWPWLCLTRLSVPNACGVKYSEHVCRMQD